MFRRFIEKISSTPITFGSWMLSVFGIIFIRIFLEQYSNNIPKHFVLTDPSTIIQYSVSFIAILLWCTAVLLIFTKKPLKEVFSCTLFFFMIIWTPPILDLIITSGKGFNIHYLFLQANEIIPAFLTLFWSTSLHGATLGIRIEIITCMILCFTLVYITTKNVWKSVASAVLLYFGIFLVFCIPSLFGIFQSSPNLYFIKSSISNSLITENSVFSIEHIGKLRLLDLGFNSLMSQGNILIALLALSLICYFGFKEKTKILLANARPERILHYSLLIVIGVMLSGGTYFLHSWVNSLSLFMTIIAFVFAWLSAVCVNDIQDDKIDTISNSHRPIPSGKFSKDEFSSISKIFLLISLLTAYSASLYGLFFVMLFSFAYYIYSAWPLKLKRHFIGGIFVVGLACISAISAGFFLASPNKELFTFPPSIVCALFLLFGIGSMVKDLKDYEGDKAEGIQTLPVVIGLFPSKIILSSFFTIGFFTISFYLNRTWFIYFSAVCAILVWKTLLEKNYKEKYFFIIYIAFLIAGLVVLIVK